MPNKDKGWDFLNVGDNEDVAYNDGDWGYTNADGSGSYYGADGSWGYKNSDGSNSYYGADGSWGYTNADGSGSYYGADGSWGYKNSDGSNSYYGADGSWGYTNADGSGSYYGADGSWEYKNPDCSSSYDDADESETYFEGDEDNENYYPDDEESNIDDASDDEECRTEEAARKQEEKRIRRERHKQQRKNIWRTITGKKQTIGISSNQMLLMKYDEVIGILKRQEFYKINVSYIEDLPIEEIGEEGSLKSISVNGLDSFEAGTLFPFNSRIEIIYHKLQRRTPPVTSRKAKRKSYKDIEDQFLNAGFPNVYSMALHDLKTGWIVKDGSVASVTINGKEDFKKKDLIRLDANIIVNYHTFK